MSWRPNRLLKHLLAWNGFITGILVWLPLVRGLMDGPTYQWGWGPGIGGRGLGGHYWVLVLAAAFSLSVLYLGWRGANPPFRWLLVLWHTALTAGTAALTLPHLGGLRLRGETLGIDIPLGWFPLALTGGLLLLALRWAVADLRLRRPPAAPAWTRRNGALLLAAGALVPVQFLLLRAGEPGSASDQAGVILTLLQWAALNLGLVPWQHSNRSRPNSWPAAR